MAQTQNYGTGRRKCAIARVYAKVGTGKIVINNKLLDDYFGRKTDRMIVKQPLVLTELGDKLDISVSVVG